MTLSGNLTQHISSLLYEASVFKLRLNKEISELSATQVGKSCTRERRANMETEEIDERDPKFIRKETNAAAERAYDQIAKDQASFASFWGRPN